MVVPAPAAVVGSAPLHAVVLQPAVLVNRLLGQPQPAEAILAVLQPLLAGSLVAVLLLLLWLLHLRWPVFPPVAPHPAI